MYALAVIVLVGGLALLALALKRARRPPESLVSRSTPSAAGQLSTPLPSAEPAKLRTCSLPDGPLTFLSIATEWDSSHGGLSTFNRELCAALARGGHRVYCGVPTANAAEVGRASAASVHLIAPAPVPGSTGVAALNRPLDGLESTVHVVIGHGRITGTAALAQVRDRLQGCLYVHFLHMDPKAIEWHKPGEEDRDAAATAEERVDLEVRLGQQASVIVAVGPELTAAFSTYFHPHHRSVHEFLPGLFTSDWDGPPPQGVSCLVFGRAEDEELKGVTLAAEAMAFVCDDDGPLRLARLVVRGALAGKGADLQSRLQTLGRDKVRVVVEPFTSDASVVRNTIRGASLVLMPSREEGFGLTGLEAISEGIPVLLSKTSGLAQAVERHLPRLASLHVVDVQNGPKHLAGRIREALNDRDTAFHRVRTLRTAMREHFDWDTAASALVEAIRRSSSAPPSSSGPAAPGPASSTTDAVTSAFTAASSALLAWRQTLHATDVWLERPELARLLEHSRGAAGRPLVLLGPPGSGKSALLARAAHELIGAGFTVLGIKADRLPNDIDSQGKLGAELGLASDVARALTSIAELRPTVLVIDQLDALGDLVDLKTERLSVLLELATRVALDAKIPVLMSCRSFDFAHDVRLRRLDAVELNLTPPDEASITQTLATQGIVRDALPPALRGLLRMPQALDVFLEVRAAEPRGALMDSYQRMLEVLWDQRLGRRDDTVMLNKAAERIAMTMAEREELWLNRALLSSQGHDVAVPHLLKAGLLVEERGRIAFAHQTIFEFARARAFIGGDQSLVEYVLARQHGLFVRPTLWTSLAYLRAVDRKAYLVNLEDLWHRHGVRRHVHMLLVEFVGQLETPEDREVALIIGDLDEDAWRPRVLEAVTGRAAWFEALRRAHLPNLLRGKDAALLVELLVKALDFAPDEATTLLDNCWHADRDKHSLLASALYFATPWSERLVAMALNIISEGTVPPHLVEGMIRTAINAAPTAAPSLVAAELTRQLARADSAHASIRAAAPADEGTDDLAAAIARRDALEPYRDLLDHVGGLHCVPDVARAAPQAFLETVWPWFVKVVGRITHLETVWLTYEKDYALGTSLRFGGHDLPIAIDESLGAVASENPAFAAAFIERWQTEKSLAVHRFLVRALEASLPSAASSALLYLLADPRRLVVGDTDDYEEASARLMARLAPELTPVQLERVESAALASRCLDESLLPPEDRRSAHDANRRHRLRLLLALGRDRLSTSARAVLDQEERRFPQADETVDSLPGGVVGSPVTTEQMLRAKDEDILRLFEELHDGTGFDHPSRFLQGGSVQASRAFAEAAKREPDRFTALLPRFRPGRSENPVAAAVTALADVAPLQRLEELVLDLVAKGFFAGEHRAEIAYAIERAAHTKGEVGEAICRLLASWLVDNTASEQTAATEPAERSDSLLFGMRGGGVLPAGNFPTLLALTTAYLGRPEPRFEPWMSMLERHLERHEVPSVWRALARTLETVLAADPLRAERFLSELFTRFPTVRDSRDGLAIIARAMHRLPSQTVERWMRDVELGTWTRRHQAYGELLVLMATRQSPPSASRERLERELTTYASAPVTAGIALGIAHCAARLWSVPERRTAATDVLLRIIPRAEESIAEAVMSAFQPEDSLVWDDATRSVLAALSAAPTVLVAEKGPWFTERLHGLLPAGSDLVADVALALARQAATESSGYLLSHGRELVDIATTLQRLGSPARERGLDLFEILLEHNAYGARATLAELDAHAPQQRSVAPRRTPHRRPRRGG